MDAPDTSWRNPLFLLDTLTWARHHPASLSFKEALVSEITKTYWELAMHPVTDLRIRIFSFSVQNNSKRWDHSFYLSFIDETQDT